MAHGRSAVRSEGLTLTIARRPAREGDPAAAAAAAAVPELPKCTWEDCSSGSGTDEDGNRTAEAEPPAVMPGPAPAAAAAPTPAAAPAPAAVPAPIAPANSAAPVAPAAWQPSVPFAGFGTAARSTPAPAPAVQITAGGFAAPRQRRDPFAKKPPCPPPPPQPPPCRPLSGPAPAVNGNPPPRPLAGGFAAPQQRADPFRRKKPPAVPLPAEVVRSITPREGTRSGGGCSCGCGAACSGRGDTVGPETSFTSSAFFCSSGREGTPTGSPRSRSAAASRGGARAQYPPYTPLEQLPRWGSTAGGSQESTGSASSRLRRGRVLQRTREAATAAAAAAAAAAAVSPPPAPPPRTVSDSTEGRRHRAKPPPPPSLSRYFDQRPPSAAPSPISLHFQPAPGGFPAFPPNHPDKPHHPDNPQPQAAAASIPPSRSRSGPPSGTSPSPAGGSGYTEVSSGRHLEEVDGALCVANPVASSDAIDELLLEDAEGDSISISRALDAQRQVFTIDETGAEQNIYLVVNHNNGHRLRSPCVYAPAGETPCSPTALPTPAAARDVREAGGPRGVGIQFSDLNIAELCGVGTQGAVYKAVHVPSKRRFAVKCIQLMSPDKLGNEAEAQQEQIRREVTLLFAHHESEHIVKIYNAYFVDSNLYFLLEYMDWSLDHIRDKAGAIHRGILSQISHDHYRPMVPTGRRASQRSRRAAGARAAASPALYSSPDTPQTGRQQRRAFGQRGPQRATPLPERIIARIVHQVLRGLDHLHNMIYGSSQGVVHKDIKPDNVLINSRGAVKLADFGCCQFVDQHGNVPMTPFNMGTEVYKSPERLMRAGPSVERTAAFAQGADIWALGITALELACGCQPCMELLSSGKGPNPHDWFHFQANLRFEKLMMPADDYRMSPEFRNFLAHCLQSRAEDRPSARQLLDYPWFELHSAARPERQQHLATWVRAITNHEQLQQQREREAELKTLERKLTQRAREHGRGLECYLHFTSELRSRQSSAGGGRGARVDLSEDQFPTLPRPGEVSRARTR
eukprot:TRINITY_DN6482_c0_g1_i2.p1 TRINITY_DN6482_c0_g1~~TRINITY_DN6482_c0_g1_i2.p1  ORF type:complete len:1025 (+),score=223.31 TRINITY_DN6482_c0_g1_i2:132-3206(+)